MREICIALMFLVPGLVPSTGDSQSERSLVGGSLTHGVHGDISSPAPVKLTAAEKAAGWKLLFDGASTASWRGYRKKGFPKRGWFVESGCLKIGAGGGGGDIITVDQYGDFELVLDWKVSPKGNSGIIYRVTEKHGASWQTGPEYQIIDDIGHGLKPTGKHAAGALYDLDSPRKGKISKPAGEWNKTRIRLREDRLEHWLNGVKVVDRKMAGEGWAKSIAASKFARYKGFGVEPRGHIALQDHGNDIWFRNIRIRDLEAPLPNEKSLFNGRDLSGWTAYLTRGARAEDVWKVDREILVCSGRPQGYIKTLASYRNYVLKLEWRFNPVTRKGGNSGVLLRMRGKDRIWPTSVEAQLMSGSAGDFWNIGDLTLKGDPQRTRGRNIKKTHAAERPLGEWNEYEIIVEGRNVTLLVNGQLLNRVWEITDVSGRICLQSEGGEIQFRRIRLAPIVGS